MRNLIHLVTIVLIALIPTLHGEEPAAEAPKEVGVHLIGNVKIPGAHMIPARARMADIIAACGGEDEFSAFKRMILIRFARQEGVTEGAIDQRKDEIHRGAQIPRDGEFYLLQQGDVIYIPVKEIIGR